MSMLENYKPEDITPSMRKYLGMPDVAQDDGTSEGAKKGWETRRLGGTSLSAGEILSNIKFHKVDGFSLCPSSGMLVHVRGSSQPHIVTNPRSRWGHVSCEVINPNGEKKEIDPKAIEDYWDGDNTGGPYPENSRKTAMRLLRRWGVEIPGDISSNISESYISGDFDEKLRHYPSEREVFQPEGRTSWKYKDDNSDVPGF